MAVSGLSVVELFADRGLEFSLRINSVEAGLVIEERRAGKSGDIEQHCQRVVSLESGNSTCFHCGSSAIKARNFFRYAFSAANRWFSLRSLSNSVASGEVVYVIKLFGVAA